MTSYGFVGYRASANVGDAVQTFALMQATGVPVGAIVDRDDLASFRPHQTTRLLVNGWFTQRLQGLYIDDSVAARFVSLHFAQERGAYGGMPDAASVVRLASGPLHEMLASSGPVGARDLFTLGLLQEAGVDSYFSACATLTLEPRIAARGDHVLAVDMDPRIVHDLRRRLQRPVISTSNYRNGSWMTVDGIIEESEAYLTELASSHLVLTSRLHAALPAAAMGIPVVFAPDRQDDPRFGGLLDFLPVVVSPGLISSLPISLFDGPFPASVREPSVVRELMAPFFEGLRESSEPTEASGCANRDVRAVDVWRAATEVERQYAIAQRDEAVVQRDEAVVQRDEAVVQRDEAVVQRDEAVVQRDEAVVQRDEAVVQRDEAVVQRDEAVVQRDEAVVQRDEAVVQRDEAVVQRDEAVVQRDEAVVQRDEAVVQRDEAVALLGAVTGSRSWRFTSVLRRMAK